MKAISSKRKKSSSSGAVWRVVDSGIREPYYTAGLDEAIMLARARGEVPNTIHLYRRATPAISMGYFQDVSKDIRIRLCETDGVKVIRRITGGGAIYTDRKQLIFAVVYKEGQAFDWPATGKRCANAGIPRAGRKEHGGCNSPISDSPISDSYSLVADALIRALARFSVEARFRPINDVVVGKKKISGSAQTRRHGVVLHHGTLLVDCDFGAMERYLNISSEKLSDKARPVKGKEGGQAGAALSNFLTSLKVEAQKAPGMASVKSGLVQGFEEALGIKAVRGALTPSEVRCAGRLASSKYSRKDWLFGRALL